MLVNEQRKKLSKRRDPVAVESYRDRGYLPDAFVNYLALLGWSPQGDQEIIGREELIEQFRLDDVHHAPAFFDVAKLTHLNGEYVRALSTEAFVEAARPWVDPEGAPWHPEGVVPPWPAARFDDAVFTAMAPLVQERIATLSEIPAMVDFLFLADPVFDEQALTKAITGDERAGSILAAAVRVYAQCEFSAEALHAETLALGEALGYKLRITQAPIRVAITGRSVGPPLFESLVALGRAEVLRRLEGALALLEP
jgi:glutamyl-tRNA synthetase